MKGKNLYQLDELPVICETCNNFMPKKLDNPEEIKVLLKTTKINLRMNRQSE